MTPLGGLIPISSYNSERVSGSLLFEHLDRIYQHMYLEELSRPSLQIPWGGHHLEEDQRQTEPEREYI